MAREPSPERTSRPAKEREHDKPREAERLNAAEKTLTLIRTVKGGTNKESLPLQHLTGMREDRIENKACEECFVTRETTRRTHTIGAISTSVES